MSNPSSIPYRLPDTLPTDPVLADLLPLFTQQWLSDLHDVHSLFVTKSDPEALYRLGHTIKGSFAQFGFTHLAPLGKDIMECSKSGDWEGAQVLLKHLEDLLGELQKRL